MLLLKTGTEAAEFTDMIMMMMYVRAECHTQLLFVGQTPSVGDSEHKRPFTAVELRVAWILSSLFSFRFRKQRQLVCVSVYILVQITPLPALLLLWFGEWF